MFNVNFVSSDPESRIRYTVTDGNGTITVEIRNAGSGGQFPQQGASVSFENGTSTTVKVDLLDRFGATIQSDTETIAAVTVSMTGRSLLAKSGITEQQLASAAEVSIRDQVGQSMASIHNDIAQLGRDMDAKDFTTSGDYWESRISGMFTNLETDVVDSAVNSTKALLAGAFSGLDTGYKLKIAVSSPYKLLYEEREARIKDAIEDYISNHPLLSMVQFDVPSSASIWNSIVDSATDGNTGDLREYIQKNITHGGILLNLNFTGANGNRVTGSIGANASRIGSTEVYRVHANVGVEHWKLGNQMNGSWLISGDFTELRGSSANSSILPDEGFNFISRVEIFR